MKLVSSKTGQLVRLGMLIGAMLIGQQALAVGTRAGTDVSNTALIDYEVGGVGQQQLSASADFVVDRRVDFDISVTDANLAPVVPGGPPSGDPDYFVEFTLTNLSNGVLDFNLGITQIAGVTFGANSDLDNVDFTTMDYAVSTLSVANGDADPARGGPQFVNELEADDSIRIRVYADPQLGLANGDIAGVRLDANGAEPGDAGAEGIPLVDTTDDDALIDNVFVSGNAAFGEDGFEVVSADLDVAKDFTIVSGDLGSGLPIPGAVIQYEITIENLSTTTAADAILVRDDIDTDVTFVSGAYAGGTDVEYTIGATTTQCTAVGDADECELAAGTLTVGGGGTLSIPASTTMTVRFQVEIPDPDPTP